LRLRRIFSSVRGQNSPPRTKEEWDASYIAGDWDYMRRSDELEHYKTILSECYEFGGGRDGDAYILDVCCGEGILLDLLPSDWYTRYVGVDLSDVAIQRAKDKENEYVSFVREDVRHFQTSERFSIIVFNECLYYFQQPLALLKRYEHYLSPNGVIIISMYQEHSNQREDLWNRIGASYVIENEHKIENSKGLIWIVKTVRPANRR